jgi:hypothetical protein
MHAHYWLGFSLLVPRTVSLPPTLSNTTLLPSSTKWLYFGLQWRLLQFLQFVRPLHRIVAHKVLLLTQLHKILEVKLNEPLDLTLRQINTYSSSCHTAWHIKKKKCYKFFRLLGHYAAWSWFKRRFETTYQSHIQGSGCRDLDSCRWDEYVVL